MQSTSLPFTPLDVSAPYQSCSIFSFNTQIGVVYPTLIDAVRSYVDGLKLSASETGTLPYLMENPSNHLNSVTLVEAINIPLEEMTVDVVYCLTSDGVDTLAQLYQKSVKARAFPPPTPSSSPSSSPQSKPPNLQGPLLLWGDYEASSSTITATELQNRHTDMHRFMNTLPEGDVLFSIEINMSSTHIIRRYQWTGGRIACLNMYNKIGAISEKYF